MKGLCERPGCSEPAAVAYGMRPEDLVFWLDRLTDVDDDAAGVLCLRHADAMVVPRNWTLDDHRDPHLHLFRPPPGVATPTTRPPRNRRSGSDDSEQLAFGADFAAAVLDAVAAGAADAPAARDAPAAPAAPPGRDSGTDTPHDVAATTDGLTGAAAPTGGAERHGDTWSPSFDERDDLDGLLSARSPLLSRAFRGDHRPRA